MAYLGLVSGSRRREHGPLATMERRTRLGYACALASIVSVSLLNAPDLRTAVILSPSLLLGSVTVFTGWHRAPNRHLVTVSALVGAVTLVWATLTLSSPAGVVGVSLTAAAVSPYRPGRVASVTTRTGVVIGGVVMMSYLVDGERARAHVIPALILIGVTLYVFAYATTDWRLLQQFERTKNAEREVSILRERHRFAADLHDIQGHTLHVIKLKTAVAARLQHSDPERTARELADVQQLVADTIARSRELANSTHTLAFTSELTNAVQLFEAAGMRVSVSTGSGIRTGEHDRTFALVLREATTNILKHAWPGSVTISTSPEALTITNDGVPRKEPAAQRGLAALADRVSASGGVLEAGRSGESFAVTVRFGTPAEPGTHEGSGREPGEGTGHDMPGEGRSVPGHAGDGSLRNPASSPVRNPAEGIAARAQANPR